MLDEVLLGKTRSAVLREMFINPDRRLPFNELSRRVNTGSGAVAREVKILLDAGLLVEQREGNHRFLAAHQGSPVFRELKAFITKTSGLPAVLREALSDLKDMIDIAFIGGLERPKTSHGKLLRRRPDWRALLAAATAWWRLCRSPENQLAAADGGMICSSVPPHARVTPRATPRPGAFRRGGLWACGKRCEWPLQGPAATGRCVLRRFYAAR